MIRLATPEDARHIAEFYHDIRMDTVPLVHTVDEVAYWIAQNRVSRGSSFVWEDSGKVIGWLDVLEDDLDQLYLRRGFTGKGIGKVLLEHAKSLSPGRLILYTFQVNTGARRFYKREGFVETALGDGTGNEEGEPDVRLEWN